MGGGNNLLPVLVLNMGHTTTHKIGILIPQSNSFPLVGKSFVNGLKLGLTGFDCEYFVEGIGLGADDKQILNSYQKLCFQNSVSITTGLLGHCGLSDLVNFAAQNGEVLLTADLGAKRPISTPKGVFQNSLGLYDSLKALVKYFDANHIQKIATSTCYYESGYDFVEALSSAMETSKNVAFSGHFITPLKPRENESELMTQTIRAVHPDAVVAFHNAIYAKEHAEFLAHNNIHAEYPIYSLPFSSQIDLIKEFPTVFEKIKVVSSWFEELDNAANKQFISDYQKAHQQSPDFFALLGYENGLVIKEALNQDGTSLTEAITKLKIEGPRGLINFNEKTNRTAYTNYLWDIDSQNPACPSKKIIADLPLSTAIPLENNLGNGSQGWMNAYLCH